MVVDGYLIRSFFPLIIVDFVQLLFNKISITVSGALNPVEMVVR